MPAGDAQRSWFPEMLTYFATGFTGGGNRRKMGAVNADKPGSAEGRRSRRKTDQEEAT